MKNFKNVLYEEAKKISIELSDKKLEKLEVYKDLLKEWNEKMNLTAITEDNGIIMKHFIDSLEIVKYINEKQKVIDVGTGAGFPGIIIAIYFENISITLLDALNKRINFLEEVVKKLNLKNVTLIHGRAEEKANEINFRNSYDVVVSRAVAQLNVLLELDSAYIKVGGKCLLMKGDSAKEEIQISGNALKSLNLKISNIYKYNYKFEQEIYNRNILEIEKISDTPKKYPRMFSKIKKNPL